MQRTIFSKDHEEFRAGFRAFLEAEAVPHVHEWLSKGTLSRDFWHTAGRMGFLGFEASPEYGGLGVRDFRYNAVIAEEVVDSGIPNDGFSLHNDIVAPYLVEYASVVLHRLVEFRTAVQVARSHIDACVVALGEDRLSAEDAAGAKYWATDLEGEVLDGCRQLFGGYGFMEEYPIGRMWRDARVQRIYGGANEIMKDIVGRGLLRVAARR